MKTSLFILPDFILGDNPTKGYIRKIVDNKRMVISTKPYMFCEKCLNRDFDIVVGINKVEKCPICGSSKISIERPRNN